MKILFNFLVTMTLVINLKAQNLSFVPLEIDSNQQNRLGISPIISNDGNYLFYSTDRNVGMLNSQPTTTLLPLNDSIVQDITKLNLNNGLKVKFSIRLEKDSIETIVCQNNYYDNVKKQLYFISRRKDTSSNNVTISLLNNAYFNILDSNMNLIYKKKLENDTLNSLILITNFCVENDSLIIGINRSSTSPNNLTKLVRYNILNGKVVSSLSLPNNAQYNTVEKLNDSIFVILTDSLLFVNKNFQLAYSLKLNSLLPNNGLPSSINYCKFDITDTSYHFVSKRVFPVTVIPQSQINEIRGNTGNFNVYGYENHDSVFNLVSWKHFLFGASNSDYKYKNHKYFSGVFGIPNSIVNGFFIQKQNENKLTEWVKYIGFDTKYSIAGRLIATNDSGCIILVNKIENYALGEISNLYWLKLDKNGNQISPLTLKKEITYEKVMFSLFPNPTQNEITFKSTLNGLCKFQIFNLNGQCVFRKDNFFEKMFKIDLSTYLRGNYIYLINTHDGNSQRGIITKD